MQICVFFVLFWGSRVGVLTRHGHHALAAGTAVKLFAHPAAVFGTFLQVAQILDCDRFSRAAYGTEIALDAVVIEPGVFPFRRFNKCIQDECGQGPTAAFFRDHVTMDAERAQAGDVPGMTGGPGWRKVKVIFTRGFHRDAL